MARESATAYGIYIGVTGAGKERSRCEDIDMVRQPCLLTIVPFPSNRRVCFTSVRSYPRSIASQIWLSPLFPTHFTTSPPRSGRYLGEI